MHEKDKQRDGIIKKKGVKMPKTILVVDDEPDIRQSVRMILEMNGYTVVEAID